MRIEYGRRSDEARAETPGGGSHYLTLLDDAGDPVLTDDSYTSLDHARVCAINAAFRLRCRASCFNCDRPARLCECLEVSEVPA